MNKVKSIFGKVWIFIRKIFKKLYEIIKKLLSTKRNRIIAIVLLFIIFIAIMVSLFPQGKKKNKFALNELYEFAPSEVRNVYANLVQVSCGGDLKFDVNVGSGKSVKELSKQNLLDYMFSYLDKNELLTDSMDDSVIKKTAKKLFNEDIDLLDAIKKYNYGDYTYNYDRGKITRVKHECEAVDKKHVLHLYGFNSDQNYLYVDINVAYLKDGILYDYNDKELGEYDEDVSKLQKLTGETSYYHITYVKENDNYKLVNVEWRNRT